MSLQSIHFTTLYQLAVLSSMLPHPKKSAHGNSDKGQVTGIRIRDAQTMMGIDGTLVKGSLHIGLGYLVTPYPRI